MGGLLYIDIKLYTAFTVEPLLSYEPTVTYLSLCFICPGSVSDRCVQCQSEEDEGSV